MTTETCAIFLEHVMKYVRSSAESKLLLLVNNRHHTPNTPAHEDKQVMCSACNTTFADPPTEDGNQCDRWNDLWPGVVLVTKDTDSLRAISAER